MSQVSCCAEEKETYQFKSLLNRITNVLEDMGGNIEGLRIKLKPVLINQDNLTAKSGQKDKCEQCELTEALEELLVRLDYRNETIITLLKDINF